MKLFGSSVVIILLAVGLQSKNAVQSADDLIKPTETPVDSDPQATTLATETPSPSTAEATSTLTNIQQTSSELTTLPNNTVLPPATEQNDHEDLLAVVNSEEIIKTSPMVETAEDHQSLRSADSPLSNKSDTLVVNMISSSSSKKDKSVLETIKAIPHINNSFVVANLLNFSYDKIDISHIGEPFELGSIRDLEFPSTSYVLHGKITRFSNIHATDVSIQPVDMFYNNFSCAAKHNRILLNVIPENMTFEGDYTVIDELQKNELFNASLLFNQTGAKLLCEFPNTSSLHHNNCDIIFANGEVKFTQLCDDQCDLLASSADMLHDVKLHILEQLSRLLITKKADQFVSAFPFLSMCSSPAPSPAKTKNYYVIKETVTKTYKSSHLQLGPMIFKGLDNFTTGNVIAVKSSLRHAPNRFLITTQINNVQGHCDWLYYKDNHRDSNNKHTFTFIIEEVKFAIGVKFTETWSVDSFDISLGKISVHRLNKTHPKILDFMKSILQDFVHDATIDSLNGLFRAQFPELIPTTSTSEATTTSTTSKTEEYTTIMKTTETRKVVYWTSSPTQNQADTTVSNDGHLPLPKRRVVKPCRDTRKWWQKIFYRNPCKKVSSPDVDQL
ncbi:uncharacterized protein LOC135834888 [Planococcus citri]|uniref:uncharacterized protein LOC135834888 n=1 Tax=Planococcus citri TaxID=170843 RepID=UPI0031F7BB60